jgi:hypothetical protein
MLKVPFDCQTNIFCRQIFGAKKDEKKFSRFIMDKLKLTRLNQGRIFHSRLGRDCIGHAIVHITKQPNLKLKTRAKQLLGSLPLAFVLPSYMLHAFKRLSSIHVRSRKRLNNGYSLCHFE